MEILLTVATLTALIILYKHLPNRRIFIYFCISLMIVFGISAIIGRGIKQEPVDEAAKHELAREQEVFENWYLEYQREIERLDRNWQLYHNLIDSYTTEDIEYDELIERLQEQEQDMRREQVNVYTMKAPAGLGAECENSVNKLIRKTQEYVDAQVQTIASTTAAVTEMEFEEHEKQIHILQDIMVRESPSGLFNADELTSIVQYFSSSSN